MFSITQFECFPLVHTQSLLAVLECMGNFFKERLLFAERLGQHDLITAAYLQIAT